MGKLTQLLKKKKTKGDGSSASDIQDYTSSSISGIDLNAPLCLDIPVSSHTSSSITQDSQPVLEMSLMDDIMDQLSGTTPDTPQPSSKSEFSDFSHVFELSRQLEQTATGTNMNSSKIQVGKLEQSSAFKDNVFLKSKLQQKGQPSAGVVAPVSRHNITPSTGATGATSDTHSNASTSILRSQLQLQATKEAEEKAEANARLREASKKANAQLPSDDEGSDSSDSEYSDEDDDARALRKQQKQLLFLQQQQLFLHQQNQPLNQVPGGVDSEQADSLVGSKKSRGDNGEPWVSKQEPINHEAVIDRMKDRHRALLAGAVAAAREDYYEEYVDEYAMAQQHMLQQPQQPLMASYNMQYAMEPNVTYGMDDYRLQQQYQQQQYHQQQQQYQQPQQQYQQHQQQMYYGQGPPAHSHSMGVPGTGCPQQSIGSGIPGYGYMSGPLHSTGYNTPAPIGSHSYMQGQTSNMSGAYSAMTSSGSEMSASDNAASPRRTCRQQSTTSSSARASEDSWAEPPVSSVSTQKTLLSDSGYGVTHDQKSSFGETEGSKFSQDSEVDEVTKVIDVLSLASHKQRRLGTDVDNEGESSQADDADDDDDDAAETDADIDALNRFKALKSLKGSVLVDSMHVLSDMTATTHTASPSSSSKNSNEHDSSDDDQPIILSRRSSGVRSTPPLPKLNTTISQSPAGYPEDALITPVHQMPYMHHGKNMYQPIQQSTGTYGHQHLPQQQHPQQQYPSMRHQRHPSASMPHGYQFPAHQAPVNMGHHHSYSVDRIPTNMNSGPGTPVSGNMTPVGQMQRHTRHSYQLSRDLRQGVMSPVNSAGGQYGQAMHPGTPVQSQYPIPPTTLLHPLPRRSQSVRMRNQNQNPMARNDSPSRQMNGGVASRGRSSVEFTRLPGGGMGVAGTDFGGANGPFIRGFSDPLSPPLQPQIMSPPSSVTMSGGFLEKQVQMQFQMPPAISHQQHQQQQQQQPFGYPMYSNEQYSMPMHPQMVQSVRR
ncbi:hypothetical protein BG004_001521 [Podila humilis]|nr:hypothetical protein BG004_001521 [Podila humilis]